MNKLSETHWKLRCKYRRVLRKIFLILGAATISLVFSACYGMPLDTYDWEDYTSTEEESSEKEIDEK